jgi:prepilin peptidase CpaA
METPAFAAGWLLLPALPVCLWVAWSDLARMKIPNKAVLALALGFAVVGPFVLPLEDWAWRWTHLVVMLLTGMLLNAGGAFGAGDAKFIAAAAPYIAFGDIGAMLFLLGGCLLVGYLLHSAAKRTPITRLAPHWVSWTSGNRFPMGFPLAVSLLLYLGMAAAG